MPAKKPIDSKYTVDPTTGCWLWNKPTKIGYSSCRFNGEMQPAHRVLYQIHKGPIPDGLHLDHLCRTPSCVNPNHLEPVTPQENTRRGNVVKVSQEMVVAMRERYAAGELLKDISADTGINQSHISEIVRGKYWLDAGGPISGIGSSRPKPGKRKLTDSQIQQIRTLRSAGARRTELAEAFGVNKHTITRVVRGKCRFVPSIGESNHESVEGTTPPATAAGEAATATAATNGNQA